MAKSGLRLAARFPRLGDFVSEIQIPEHPVFGYTVNVQIPNKFGFQTDGFSLDFGTVLVPTVQNPNWLA